MSPSADQAVQVAARVLREEASALAALAGRLGPGVAVVVDEILRAGGRVVCCGLGKSGHVAAKAAATFASTGTPSLFLHAAEALHGDLGMVAAGDVLLAYSYSGETDEIVRVLGAAAGQGAITVVVTGRESSSAARAARHVLDAAVDSEACPNNLAPTTSTTAMLALSDALAVAVMEARGFGPEDFARLHPAGTLGRRLTLRVRDVMRTGDDLPTVLPGTPVLEVMRVISSTGAGGACVISESGGLAGYISDGDLRRHFSAGHSAPFSLTAAELMTTSPATIEPTILAVEALEFFQNYVRLIGEVPVLEDDRLVGLLILKDLLRSGLV